MLHGRYLGSFHHKNINRFGVNDNNYCFIFKNIYQVMAVVYVLTHSCYYENFKPSSSLHDNR